jgi:deazaflavin-dependent oxidoreductase (nitroreductase family)
MKHFHKNLSRRMIDALSTSGIKRGIGPSQLHLLTVLGRKTGVPHTTPVSVVVQGTSRFLVAPYGEVEWVRNARTAGVVTLTRGGRSERFSVTPLAPAQAGPILSQYVKLEPVTRPYFNLPANAAAEAFEAEVPTHPVFSLEPLIGGS